MIFGAASLSLHEIWEQTTSQDGHGPAAATLDLTDVSESTQRGPIFDLQGNYCVNQQTIIPISTNTYIYIYLCAYMHAAAVLSRNSLILIPLPGNTGSKEPGGKKKGKKNLPLFPDVILTTTDILQLYALFNCE